MAAKVISKEILQPQGQGEAQIAPRDLYRVFWHPFQMEFSWSYERQMNLAFVYALTPILKKLYPRKKELAGALRHYLVLPNTTPHIVTLLLGITTAMEEKSSRQKNMDATAIDNIEAPLMGPLARLEDSLFWGTLCLIATGIGTSLALKSNIPGPIPFLLMFSMPHILVCWCFIRWGYVLGTGVLQRVQRSGMMKSLTYEAPIVGLMVVGAMTVSVIDITTPFSFGTGEAKTQVQDITNDILPCMLPLVSFSIVYWPLGQKVKPLSIIGGMTLIGVLDSWIGLFQRE